MRQIIWLEVILLAALVGCIPRFQFETLPQGIRPKTKIETTKLVSANNPDASLINQQEGNCPVNEAEIAGQGARAVGSIGGLAIKPNPVDSSGASIPTFDPFTVGSDMFTTADPTSSEPTAIIIVDDFNGNEDLEQPGVYFLDQRDGPTLAGLTSGATEAEVTALEDAGQYSHGALVFNHTLALLSAGDPTPRPADFVVNLPVEDIEINVPAFIFTGPNIVVAALDTQDFNTAIIGGRLQATIQTLARQQIRRFAVNLSFGLVPCSVLADIEAGVQRQPDLTFEEYQAEVFDENKDNPDVDAAQLREDLVNILTTPVNVDSDPLLTGAETNPEQFANAAVTDITYLAASGNYSLPYSLYPGYWSEFVSTSAHNLADTSAPPVRDPDYSNTGEVLMPGGYYKLTAYDPDTGGFRTYSEISIAGTSFAAPVLSVFTALDFTQTAPRCARISPSITSPLAFFKTDPTPTSLPASGLNITLERALDPAGTPRICGSP